MTDKPEENVDPEIQVTPETPAAIPTETQPEPTKEVTAPDFQQLYEKEVTKGKRNVERIHGLEKQNEDLSVKKIIDALGQPEEVQPQVEVDEEPVAKSTPQINPLLSETIVRNTLRGNKAEMSEKYGTDKYVPWTRELAAEVETELIAIDPTGQVALNPAAWEKGYEIVRGKKINSIMDNRANDELAEKTKRDAVIAATTPTAPSQPVVTKTSKPNINSMKSDEVKATIDIEAETRRLMGL